MGNRHARYASDEEEREAKAEHMRILREIGMGVLSGADCVANSRQHDYSNQLVVLSADVVWRNFVQRGDRGARGTGCATAEVPADVPVVLLGGREVAPGARTLAGRVALLQVWRAVGGLGCNPSSRGVGVFAESLIAPAVELRFCAYDIHGVILPHHPVLRAIEREAAAWAARAPYSRGAAGTDRGAAPAFMFNPFLTSDDAHYSAPRSVTQQESSPREEHAMEGKEGERGPEPCGPKAMPECCRKRKHMFLQLEPMQGAGSAVAETAGPSGVPTKRARCYTDQVSIL